MNIVFENISLDLFNLLIFIMPGFFFLKVFSGKPRTGFEYMVLSLFWGILLMILYYYVIPTERFISFVQNPYAGSIIFSIFSILLAFIIRFVIDFIRNMSNGTW